MNSSVRSVEGAPTGPDDGRGPDGGTMAAAPRFSDAGDAAGSVRLSATNLSDSVRGARAARRARCISLALSQRSFLSSSSARSMTIATDGGTCGASSRTGRGRSVALAISCS